ncbi:MAG: cytochrome c biogenesis protein CcsA [Nitrospirae bacterium]|nr:cytochrome c biogenesis protein CcsA [Nitrospirota bacterium]
MDNILLSLAIVSSAFYIFGYFRMPFVFAGLILQIAYLFVRGISLDRMPLVGPHDTLFFMSASIVLFALPVAWKMKERKKVLHSSVGMAVVFMLMALLYKPHNSPLPPVLKTFWFETHVAFSFFSYALFGIAAILGILFIMNREREFDLIQYKINLVGYCFFSAAMIFGGIWAYLAWGTYWLWTPKELWTVILWLYYSLYLHARLRPWWSGRPVSVMSVAGFLIVLFTYLGVSLFMKSSHSF